MARRAGIDYSVWGLVKRTGNQFRVSMQVRLPLWYKFYGLVFCGIFHYITDGRFLRKSKSCMERSTKTPPLFAISANQLSIP